MQSPTNNSQSQGSSLLSRQELLLLHNHYESVEKDELEFFFKYKNFYTGLLSALLAGTITGLITTKSSNGPILVLLIGPVVVILLSIIGYGNLKVYYRRFMSAIVTVINIKSMLGLLTLPATLSELGSPIFPSRHGRGFITQYKRPPIQKFFAEAAANGLAAEEVVEHMQKRGITLTHAKYTFLVFDLAALILFICIISR